MSGATQILLIILAFAFGLVLTGLLTVLPGFLPDVPNQRSLHRDVRPRGGGLSFALLFLAALALIAAIEPEMRNAGALALGVGAFFLGGLGLLDDRFNLPASTRLLLEIAVCLPVCALGAPDRLDFLGVVSLEGWPALLAQTFWLLVCINFFNFMDGIDGLAASQAWWIALGLGALFWLDGACLAQGCSLAADSARENFADAGMFRGLALLYLILAAAVLGFLAWNLPPARIFMGDSGSYFLGFTLGFAALIAPYAPDASHSFQSIGLRLNASDWPPLLLDHLSVAALWTPLLADATFTLVRRVWRGGNPFEAHRTHLYQLLYRSGWTPLTIAGLYLLAGIVCVGPIGLRAAGALPLAVFGAHIVAAAALLLLYVRAAAWLEPRAAAREAQSTPARKYSSGDPVK